MSTIVDPADESVNGQETARPLFADESRPLLEMLGYRSNLRCWRIDNAVPANWPTWGGEQGYRASTVGIEIPTPADAPPPGASTMFTVDGRNVWLRVILFEVRRPSTLISVSATIHATRGYMEQLHSIDHADNLDDMTAIARDSWPAIMLLRNIEQQTRGRPRLEDDPYADWESITERAIRRYQRRENTLPWKEIARIEGVPYGTFRKWRKRYEELHGKAE